MTYVWQNSNARADRAYEFGASFPAKYIPAAAITRPSATERLGISADSFTGFGCCVGFFAIFAFFTALGVYNGQKRKLQYLPPKVAIEGHGIKRGLTAPEAAILMEQPMDKVLSMILFAVIKKNAASVVTRDPLKLNITDPQPEDLRDYEKDFLEAYKTEDTHPRRLALQTATINLVNSVSAKMKGFSRKETIEYYRSIVASAWKQVEDADTPQVKSERYDEVMEWTMLDDDYDRRTARCLPAGPSLYTHLVGTVRSFVWAKYTFCIGPFGARWQHFPSPAPRIRFCCVCSQWRPKHGSGSHWKRNRFYIRSNQ